VVGLYLGKDSKDLFADVTMSSCFPYHLGSLAIIPPV